MILVSPVCWSSNRMSWYRPPPQRQLRASLTHSLTHSCNVSTRPRGVFCGSLSRTRPLCSGYLLLSGLLCRSSPSVLLAGLRTAMCRTVSSSSPSFHLSAMRYEVHVCDGYVFFFHQYCNVIFFFEDVFWCCVDFDTLIWLICSRLWCAFCPLSTPSWPTRWQVMLWYRSITCSYTYRLWKPSDTKRIQRPPHRQALRLPSQHILYNYQQCWL